MSAINLSGSWRGLYSYDPEYELDGYRVEFDLDLKRMPWAWLTGAFRGTVQDGTGGMPGLGGIYGTLRGVQLRFCKSMPVAYIMEGGKLITMRESVLKEGYRVDKEIPDSPIFYEGTFRDHDYASGSWVKPEARLPIPSVGVIPTCKCSGQWTLTRLIR